ncbi:MAG: pentapeptide repeat-containing protein [Gammaproteobacteria bacterium]|nr:pentapeptide repeat-containing protein [Gammaproteobacteria bacterium]
MNRKEALELLRGGKRGVREWNRRRGRGREKTPSLREADLAGADLEGADLGGTILDRADLNDANLTNANLAHASLTDAYLVATRLVGAVLENANFQGAKLPSVKLAHGDFAQANLMETTLSHADLTGANLRGAELLDADLQYAVLTDANLEEVDLSGADLRQSDLTGANLTNANLTEVNLLGANLFGANLTGAVLWGARLVRTTVDQASFHGSRIYGISAWDLQGKPRDQSELIITRGDEPTITVDNLKVAQFIYLLLNNEEIRHAIDTVTSKTVLILGRFTDQRKVVLDAIRDRLRERGYLPVLFDFEKPISRDLTETVSTLAHMARFIIADLTLAKSVAAELESIVPGLPSVPVAPVVARGDSCYALFEHIRRFPWVLEPYSYESEDDLIFELDQQLLASAEAKVEELSGKQPPRAREIASGGDSI